MKAAAKTTSSKVTRISPKKAGKAKPVAAKQLPKAKKELLQAEPAFEEPVSDAEADEWQDDHSTEALQEVPEEKRRLATPPGHGVEEQMMMMMQGAMGIEAMPMGGYGLDDGDTESMYPYSGGYDHIGYDQQDEYLDVSVHRPTSRINAWARPPNARGCSRPTGGPAPFARLSVCSARGAAAFAILCSARPCHFFSGKYPAPPRAGQLCGCALGAKPASQPSPATPRSTVVCPLSPLRSRVLAVPCLTVPCGAVPRCRARATLPRYPCHQWPQLRRP